MKDIKYIINYFLTESELIEAKEYASLANEIRNFLIEKSDYVLNANDYNKKQFIKHFCRVDDNGNVIGSVDGKIKGDFDTVKNYIINIYIVNNLFSYINKTFNDNIYVRTANIPKKEITFILVNTSSFNKTKLYQFVKELFVDKNDGIPGINYINSFIKNNLSIKTRLHDMISDLWKGYVTIIVVLKTFQKYIPTSIEYKKWFNDYIKRNNIETNYEKLNSKLNIFNIDQYHISYFDLVSNFVKKFNSVKLSTDDDINLERLIQRKMTEAMEDTSNWVYNFSPEFAVNLSTFQKANDYAYDICYEMNGHDDGAVWCVTKSQYHYDSYTKNGLLFLVIKYQGNDEHINYKPYMLCIKSFGEAIIADVENIEERMEIRDLTKYFSSKFINSIVKLLERTHHLAEPINEIDTNYYKPLPYNQWTPVLIAKGFIKKNTGGNKERSNYLTVHTAVGDVNIDGTTIYGMLKIAGNNKNFYNKLLTQSKDNSNLFEPININDYYSEIKKFVEENPDSKNNVNHTLIPQAFYNIVINHKN